jgi:hypothetical protein
MTYQTDLITHLGRHKAETILAEARKCRYCGSPVTLVNVGAEQ